MSRQFYCYTHSTPDGGVFYVGAGAARRPYDLCSRSKYHKEVVALHGRKNIIVSLYPCGSREEALHMERFVISVVFGRDSLVNRYMGGEGVCISTSNAERQQKYREKRSKEATRVSLRISKKAFERLASLAAKQGVSREKIVERLLEKSA